MSKPYWKMKKEKRSGMHANTCSRRGATFETIDPRAKHCSQCRKGYKYNGSIASPSPCWRCGFMDVCKEPLHIFDLETLEPVPIPCVPGAPEYDMFLNDMGEWRGNKSLTPQVVYVLAESKEGTVFRSADRGETFTEMSREPNVVNRGFYYTDLRVDPANEDRVYAISGELQASPDGGKTWKRLSRTTHVDFHALWIDPKDPARMWQGQDGGVAVSSDRGESWAYHNNFAIGQFYQVFADDAEPFYNLGGGMQDNGTWWGPSRTKEPAGILNDDWRMVNFGDGFFLVRHPDEAQVFLSEYQGGAIARTDIAGSPASLRKPRCRSLLNSSRFKRRQKKIRFSR